MASEHVTMLLTLANGTTQSLLTQGTASFCRLESRAIQIHPQGREVYIDGARIEITPQGGLDRAVLKVGIKDRLDDAVTWLINYTTGGVEFPMNFANYVFDFRGEGRFVQFFIEDREVKTQWKLSAIELYGMPTKGRRY